LKPIVIWIGMVVGADDQSCFAKFNVGFQSLCKELESFRVR
jgi:hypothetical protein